MFTNLGDLLLESLPAILVEQHLSVHFLPELSLGPFFLLGLTSRKGSSKLLLLGLLLNLRTLCDRQAIEANKRSETSLFERHLGLRTYHG